MRLTFVLPDFVPVPVGGMKVAYRHANELARRGHQVTLLRMVPAAGPGSTRAARLTRDLRVALWRRGKGGWFELDRRIRTGSVVQGRPDALPAADATVAVGWVVTGLVNDAPLSAGRKQYLVQGYMAGVEGAPGEVDAHWRLPLRKIVIARWLEDKVREVCGPNTDVVRIPAAVDAEYTVLQPPEDRSSDLVSLLYHAAPWKGFDIGLAALAIARRSRPALHAIVFGAERPPAPLPEWAEFRLQPNLPVVHNECAIHVHPSWLEAWPLVPAEAMACGSAVVGAANDGLSEFAVHERNALLVPVRHSESLAAAVLRLVEDDELRYRLAWSGVNDMRSHTWERASRALEAVLSGDR